MPYPMMLLLSLPHNLIYFSGSRSGIFDASRSTRLDTPRAVVVMLSPERCQVAAINQQGERQWLFLPDQWT